MICFLAEFIHESDDEDGGRAVGDKGSISGHRHSRDIQRMHSLTTLTTTIYYLEQFTTIYYLELSTICRDNQRMHSLTTMTTTIYYLQSAHPP